MNHYPRHLGDYLKKTLALSMQEDGAYTRLTDVYYDTEKPLPLDHRELHKLTRCSSVSDRKAVDKILARYFERRDDGYHQKRCDEEIAKYQGKSAKASNSAVKSWLNRSTKAHANADAIASANAKRMQMPSQSVGNANQNQDLTHGGESPTVPSPGSANQGASSPSKGKNGAWWKTDQGIDAEAKAEHITPNAGETYEHLKQRVFDAKARRQRA